MRLLLWFAVCSILWNVGDSFGILDIFFKWNSFPFNPTTQNPHKENPTKNSRIDSTSAPYLIMGVPSTVLFSIHQTINAQKPDEDTIVKLISTSTYHELNMLQSAYQVHYGIGLTESLRNILTGELEEAVISWMIPRDLYYAREIHSAIFGMGADERAIIDIFCIFNNSMIQKIDTAYGSTFYRFMKNDLMNILPKSFERLLHLSSEFQSYDKFNIHDVLEIAKDESSFINFLASHPSDIFKFAMEYYRQSKKYLENTIIEKYSGDLQRALLSIVYYAKGEHVFFSRRLHDCLEGDTTVDYHSLIRLAIMEKKVSYQKIRDLYKTQFQKNLDEVMTKKIGSGNFRKLIEALFQRKQDAPEEYIPLLTL